LLRESEVVEIMRFKPSKTLIISAVVATLCVTSIVIARASNVRDSLILFNEVLTKVRDEYVDRVDIDKLIEGAIRGMLDTLDPHSSYLTKKQYDDLMISTHGSFGGLGIEIDIRNDWLTVIAPIEGTPAHRAGIRGGDKVVKIDGASTRGISMNDAIEKLRGPKGTNVTITIQREGEPELLDYTITRDVIKIKSVPFATVLDGNVGYIRLAQFSEDTSEELRAALATLKAKGMQKLVLDLRRNTGGLLTQAIEVSEEFVKPGQTVVSTKGRRVEQNREYKAGARASGSSYPMIILVDNTSASASEIVAGAVQDLDRGLVVGTPSFGKGTVQSVIRLPGEGALKLTTAKYYTPSGRCINKDEGPTEESAIIYDEATRADSGTVYYTSGGRAVYGGGGIRPDIEIKQDDVPRIATPLARQGLVFEFAVHYVATHKDVEDLGLKNEAVLMREFQDFLKTKDFQYTDAEFEEGREFVGIMVRSEIARKIYGDDAAYTISLEGDTQLKKTADLLRGASDLPGLLKMVAEETGVGAGSPR
jgi:carboxyl-terminal processing protease